MGDTFGTPMRVVSVKPGLNDDNVKLRGAGGTTLILHLDPRFHTYTVGDTVYATIELKEYQ